MHFHVFLSIFAVAVCTVTAKIEMTNINCRSVDKAFSDFEYCYLKSVNRSFKYMSLKVKLFKVPINNITLNISLMKKANGYKPFLYNVTFNACAFLKGRRNPVESYFYGLIQNHSNMNHTCPFNQDLRVDKLDVAYLNNHLTKILPMPEGDYGFFTSWIAYNILRAKVDFFMQLSD